MIGRTLTHYRITAAIGASEMGEVYRATRATVAELRCRSAGEPLVG
jgi:hypothetical protein